MRFLMIVKNEKGRNMLNFTVGPVMSDPEILEITGESAPYFRTPEFSDIMLENEKLILEMVHAPEGSKAVFLTTSGTGAMESCVMNILNDQDKVIVINGGSFGARFAELCKLHKLDHTGVKCEFGKQLRREQLSGLEDYTALLINMHETSSGVLYDMKMVAEFCRENNILLIVDAISAFLADELDMEALGASAVITGSQKALAAFPGISLIALSPEALERIEKNPEQCMYLSLKLALLDGKRGQTPFTPAVSTLLQINKRLKKIMARGGAKAESARIAKVAEDFRNGIKELPFEPVSDSPSNEVTSLRPLKASAKDIFRILKDEYDIWICPNGGQYAETVFRVGHIGYITDEDNKKLIDALKDLERRGLI